MQKKVKPKSLISVMMIMGSLLFVICSKSKEWGRGSMKENENGL